MLISSYRGSIASAVGADASSPPQANCFVESGADTVVVNSMAALESAVATAPPGRNILVAPGTYSGGSFTFTGNGAGGSPIVIRPQNGLETVTINAPRWTIANTSSWLIFSKIHFTSSRIGLMGDHNRISRCRFRNCNVDASIVIGQDGTAGGARDCRIDHCEFSDFTGAVPAISIRPAGFANGLQARVLIDYCYFHDHLQDVAVINSFGNTSWADLPQGETIILDHCLFDNINRTGEYIIVKIGGWVTRFCTFTNMNGYLSFRTAGNCELRSCWFEGASHEAMKGFGPGHLVIGNRFVGGINLWAPCGNASWANILSGAAPINTYAPTTNGRFIGNRMGSGNIIVGEFWPSNPSPGASFPADSNLLEANTRDSGGSPEILLSTKFSLTPPHINTTVNSTTTETFTPAVKLTASDVGLPAADPLCP